MTIYVKKESNNVCILKKCCAQHDPKKFPSCSGVSEKYRGQLFLSLCLKLLIPSIKCVARGEAHLPLSGSTRDTVPRRHENSFFLPLECCIAQITKCTIIRRLGRAVNREILYLRGKSAPCFTFLATQMSSIETFEAILWFPAPWQKLFTHIILRCL